MCTKRPIRQDYLDQLVWNEVTGLLENPELVQAEIDRRRAAARNADPLRKREEELRREQVRLEKNSERLLTAYQEGLVTLSQLRQRMPDLQKQTQAVSIGITIFGDGGSGPGQIPATGRRPNRIFEQTPGTSWDVGYRCPATDCATRGEGSAGRHRYHHDVPFGPDSAVRNGIKWSIRSALRCHRINVESRFSFAFEYFQHINADPVIFRWKYKMDETVIGQSSTER